MSATSTPSLAPDSFSKKLRHLAVGGLFVLVLLIPKMLHLRRNPRSWMLFRILLAVARVALVIVPLGAWGSYVPAIVGLAMFVSAIFFPAAKSFPRVRDKARELGGLVFLNGGGVQPGGAPAVF